MKLPFRFHRGELNGYFLNHLVTFLNYAVSYLLDELVYWTNVQFKTAGHTNPGELPMRDSDIVGIAAVAGLFTPYLLGGIWFGEVFLTESHIVGGVEYSERGLYSKADNAFIFVRTDPNPYEDDISSQASPDYRMSLIPTGAPVLGYVRADENLYDTDGNVIWANVHATIPVGVAWDPFYGEKYSTLSSDAHVTIPTPIELTVELLQLLQKIRRSGTSIAIFLEITQSILQDYVYDISIAYSSNRYQVTYYVNADSTIDNPLQRYNLWQYIVRMKFKLFELSEVL